MQVETTLNLDILFTHCIGSSDVFFLASYKGLRDIGL
mgnify:CR=1 FL=1